MTIEIKKTQFIKLILLTFFLFIQNSIACGGYKITIGNRTFFGSNYDAWFTKPHIWFENATSGRFGAAFTGARFDGENGYAPQSGMNERGLVFERLAAYHPVQEKFQNRKTISKPTKYLKDILHKKIGDGTLLSSIWDCNKGTVNLYFYHDYKKTVQFVLSEELKRAIALLR